MLFSKCQPQNILDMFPKESLGSAGNAEEEAKLKLAGKLVFEEEEATGSVNAGAYLDFCKYAGGLPVVLSTLLMLILGTGTQFFGNWWLQVTPLTATLLRNISKRRAPILLDKYRAYWYACSFDLPLPL